MAKSARDHLNSEKPTKMVVLDKDFAGVKRDQELFAQHRKLSTTAFEKSFTVKLDQLKECARN